MLDKEAEVIDLNILNLRRESTQCMFTSSFFKHVCMQVHLQHIFQSITLWKGKDQLTDGAL